MEGEIVCWGDPNVNFKAESVFETIKGYLIEYYSNLLEFKTVDSYLEG